MIFLLNISNVKEKKKIPGYSGWGNFLYMNLEYHTIQGLAVRVKRLLGLMALNLIIIYLKLNLLITQYLQKFH